MNKLLRPALLGVMLAMVAEAPGTALAADDLDALRKTVEALQRQLQQVQQRLEEQEAGAASRDEIGALKQAAVRVEEQLLGGAPGRLRFGGLHGQREHR